MEMTHYFETLGKRVDESITSVRAAAAEDAQQLQHSIDKAQADAGRALAEAEKKTDDVAGEARGRWSQMQADAAARLAEVKTKIDRGGDEFNAELAGLDAEVAEADAVAAIDYAGWAIDNARLTALYALDSRARAERLAREKVNA